MCRGEWASLLTPSESGGKEQKKKRRGNTGTGCFAVLLFFSGSLTAQCALLPLLSISLALLAPLPSMGVSEEVKAPSPPKPKDDDAESLKPSNIESAEYQQTSNDAEGEEEEEEEEGDDSGADDEDEGVDEEQDVGEPKRPNPQSEVSRLRDQKSKLENLVRRISSERVPLRVHDVLIKGNSKTKEWLIEAELEGIKNATSMQELLEAAGIANAKLQRLEIFDSVRITLDSGPPELPDTANVIVEVVEIRSPLTGECGAYTKTAARSWMLEATFKYKNFLGYGDLWDASFAYGPNQTSEVSVGVFVPRLKNYLTPRVARLSLLSQDWQELSSYKDRSLGLSLGLFSSEHHDLVYNIGWRTLTDPSRMASRPVRRQLGHGLLSTLKYTFKIDQRNSSIRPLKGYAFVSTSQVGGLAPDRRSLQFLRQEFDLRYAFPLGFHHTALNLGISAGVIFPWGHGFLNKTSPLPERFFLGGDFSPVCTLGGPTTVWGFKTRGLSPTEPRRQVRDKDSDHNSNFHERDYIGGDLAVSAFADLSFDLPFKWLREHGIHGHLFAGVGNIAKLTENEFRYFSLQNFLKSFRSSVGVGVVVPTTLFRLEGNFYYMLKQQEYDRGKTGFRFSFSAPS